MNLIFYITLFLFILLFSTLDIGIDYDFWARLIVGKSFFQTGQLFPFDFYSYGTTHNFLDHEWGSSLVFYLIQNHLGDIGLYFFKAIMIFLTFIFIIKTIELNKKDIKLHFLFFFFAIQSICYTLFATVRCQTFSFFFFALFLYLLKRICLNKEYRLLWCFPILNIIWANLHGGFVLGLVLIAIFTIGEFLNNKKSKTPIYLLVTFFITLLTTLINPYGFEYLKFIFDAFSLNRVHITEWQSAFFNKHYIYSLLKFKLYFFIVFGFFTYSIIKDISKTNVKDFYKNIDKTKYLLIIFVSLIALKALRCHVFFTLSIIALCYSDFYNIFNKQLPKWLDNTKEIILLVLILISTATHIHNYKFINTVKEKVNPIQSVEFIKLNNLKGNVFANFHNGSYVAYKLYPYNHVFMDGRYEEVYDNNLINKMGDAFLTKTHNEFLNEFHHDILIIDKFYPLFSKMKEHKDWFLAFEEKEFGVFLNKKYKKHKFKIPTNDKNYYNKTKFETSINWLN